MRQGFWMAQGHMLLQRMGLVLAVVLLLGAANAQADNLTEVGLKTYPEGKATTLAKYKGQPVLVNFWAPWCVPCRKEFPEFQKLQERYAGKFHMVGVTAERDNRKVALFLEKTGAKFDMLLDPESSLHKLVNVTVMPTTVLLDKNGNLAKAYQGFNAELGLQMMEKDLQGLLGQ